MEEQMMIFELNSKECRLSDPEAQDKKVKLKAWELELKKAAKVTPMFLVSSMVVITIKDQKALKPHKDKLLIQRPYKNSHRKV